jgi:hypothetical protein
MSKCVVVLTLDLLIQTASIVNRSDRLQGGTTRYNPYVTTPISIASTRRPAC